MIPTPDVLDSPSTAAAGEAARLAIRRGVWTGATLGLAAQCVQAHVVILPAALAEDFRDFCVRNPRACSLLAVTEPGQAMLPTLGDDIDVRCDLPAYQVWRDGELIAARHDILSIWRRDLVSFVLAGSFAFEQTLAAQGRNEPGPAPTYATQVPTAAVGPFGGPLRVAMRGLRSEVLIQAVESATRCAEAHGTPVHVGEPALIGIPDLSTPEHGEARQPLRGELPVFWASGLTAHAAARAARPALCITNVPGAMLVTDLLHRQATSPEAAPRATAASASPVRSDWR